MRRAVPLLEVDRARLFDQVAAVVVDPVARERARPDHLVLDRAVGANRQAERRPRGRSVRAEGACRVCRSARGVGRSRRRVS